MDDSALEAQVAAAEAYEEFFVPALFAEWAPRLVAAAGLGPGDRALDVACGTGVLTRQMVRATGPGGQVTAVDINPGMLLVAERLAGSVLWHQAPAESLPFPAAHFDAVLSQFGLMFFQDQAGALAEMYRVVRPGGRLAVAVWASLEDTPAYRDEVALLERCAGRAAAGALSAPFSLGQTEPLLALFEHANVPGARVTTVVGRARFPSIRTMVETDLRGWLPLVGIPLEEAAIARILEEAETALAAYRTASGAVEFESPAHIVTAIRPA